MFMKNLANLIKVKTLVTLAVVAAFIAKALMGDISEDNFMAITLTIVAFYFGTQSEKPKKDTPEQ